MAIANALSGDSENTVKVYDKNFNQLISYEIKLTRDVTCQQKVVSVGGVFFCNDYAILNFLLPCIEKGNYTLEIFEIGQATPIPIYTLAAIAY